MKDQTTMIFDNGNKECFHISKYNKEDSFDREVMQDSVHHNEMN